MSRGALASLGVVALLASGCGGKDATSVLSATAANLGKIRSGTLHVELLVSPHGTKTGTPFGFELAGPFSLGGSGSLPLLDVEYTQIANGKRATVTLVSDGRHAYVETGGRRIALSPEQEQALRSASGPAQTGALERQFPIGSWVEHAKVSDGGEVGGADTDKVTAELDVARAARDLLGLARSLGRPVPELGADDRKRLADSVRSSSFELYTGKKDRLLRRLRIDADFGLDVPKTLRAALGALVGARFTFELAVDRPNRKIARIE